MKIFIVYILKCSDNTFHTGFTPYLDKGIQDHLGGYNITASTYRRKPVELIWFEHFTDPNHAIAVEKQLKVWNLRKKLDSIDEDWEKLAEYSKISIHTELVVS
jgi:putative endonuclease